MPATRSRTENWRQSLQDIFERNGALELTLPRYLAPDNTLNEHGLAVNTAQNIIWRVRIVGMKDDEILVEEPSALGHTFTLDDGVELVGIISIGQNRWMFRTSNLGRTTVQINRTTSIAALRLRMPTEVERCQRRNFYRVSTIGLSLPSVEVYPVLEPDSIMVAETASRVQIEEAVDTPVIATVGHAGAVARGPLAEPTLLPHCGPMIKGSLMNIGGGGVGLLFEPEDRAGVDAMKLVWLRIRLQPHIPAPLGVAARIRHTHIDSAQRVYAGVMFEFGQPGVHQKFVVEQLCRYVALVQREQLRRHQNEVE